eukprot:NODE_2320_length_1450_cov_27.703843_g2204_i0.p1 GENE.NODE_2320_length_1450_cov_27.703843_g2204_i0~~NODE_2320_length_1450_cov_27.703843_g2204_i0.p1  ORF type:complete len:440 (+),score=94.74 NODE_2320_length_1450_cov_27.703843_g2204_i0:67-1320(+)
MGSEDDGESPTEATSSPSADCEPSDIPKADQPSRSSIDDGKAVECGYYDVVTVSRISHLLLQGIARAALAHTEGNPFKDANKMSQEVLQAMLPFLEKHSSAYSTDKVQAPAGNLPYMTENGIPLSPITNATIALLMQFSKEKRNFFSMLSHTFSSTESEKSLEKLDQLTVRLRDANVWPAGAREGFAKGLIRRIDATGVEYCAAMMPEAQLADHKITCPLRPNPCTNPGCTEILCARHVPLHNTVCPFLMLPCRQGCEKQIARNQMDEHCGTVCERKIVSCPFQTLGCEATVYLGTYIEHLQSSVEMHLRMVNKTVLNQGSDINGLQLQLAAVVTQVEAVSGASFNSVTTMDKRLGELEKHHLQLVGAVEKENKQLRKENESLRDGLDKEQKARKKEIAALTAELKELKEFLLKPRK